MPRKLVAVDTNILLHGRLTALLAPLDLRAPLVVTPHEIIRKFRL